jgi:hypothetical protein
MKIFTSRSGQLPCRTQDAMTHNASSIVRSLAFQRNKRRLTTVIVGKGGVRAREAGMWFRPRKMAGKIFIDYRRDDSMDIAGRLQDRLAQAFGRKNLFVGVDRISGGVDFEVDQSNQVAACQAFLTVIGPNWLEAKDESGQRRLHDPNDSVAIEILAALTRNIHVIPVLVDGAHLPNESELPESLKALARCQALQLRQVHFDQDAEALVKRVREALGGSVGLRSWRRMAAAVTAGLLLFGLIGLHNISAWPPYDISVWQPWGKIRAGHQPRPRANRHSAACAEDTRGNACTSARANYVSWPDEIGSILSCPGCSQSRPVRLRLHGRAQPEQAATRRSSAGATPPPELHRRAIIELPQLPSRRRFGLSRAHHQDFPVQPLRRCGYRPFGSPGHIRPPPVV